MESKRCAHNGCTKYPIYGVAGSKRTEYCAQHALDGMINVMSKRCAQNGCTKQPSYGVAGSRKAEYCSQHALDGMINVVSKRCTHNGCTKNRATEWLEPEKQNIVHSMLWRG